jgi:hypothetical protein
MKANELMIGDIVIVNNTPLKIAALGTQKAGFIDAKGTLNCSFGFAFCIGYFRRAAYLLTINY